MARQARAEDMVADATRSALHTFIWTDLASTDLDASARFYGQLFGWTTEIAPDPQARGYTFFKKEGRVVAAMGPPGPGEPPSWRPYIKSSDAASTAAAVRAAGGTVLLEPMQVLKAGTLATFRDPGGAVFCAWQAEDLVGADLLRQPGALSWVELVTGDVDTALRFYPEVFGWTVERGQRGGRRDVQFMHGQEAVGGCTEASRAGGDQPPPSWLVYFAVTDCDRSAQLAKQLGGAVFSEPSDIPDGARRAILGDPHGARFGILG